MSRTDSGGSSSILPTSTLFVSVPVPVSDCVCPILPAEPAPASLEGFAVVLVETKPAVVVLCEPRECAICLNLPPLDKSLNESTIRLLFGNHQQESLTVHTDGFQAYGPLEADDAFDREYFVHGDSEYAEDQMNIVHP